MDALGYAHIYIIAGQYDYGIRYCNENDINPRSRNVHIITPQNHETRLRGVRGYNSIVLHAAYGTANMNDLIDHLMMNQMYTP